MAYPPDCSCRCLVFFLPGVSLQTACPYSVATAAAGAAVTRLATNCLVAEEAGGTMYGKGNLGLGLSTSQRETRSLIGCWSGCADPLR